MLGPGALSIPLSDRLSTKQSLLVHVSGTSSSNPSVPSCCLQDAHHPSTKFRRCAPEKDVLVQDWEGCQDNSMMGASRHRYNLRTRCQENLRRPAVATNTCPPVTTRAGLPMSTHEGHKLLLGRDCLYLLMKDTSHD